MYKIGQKEIERITALIESKKLFRYQLDGEGECRQFEKEVAKHLGAKYALLVTSGTNAIVAALASLGVGPGDEVLIPSYTFAATAIAVTNVGAIPVVVNIDESYTIDLIELEKKITDRTKAIIPVHIDGIPCHMNQIMDLAHRHKLHVVEDACQAFGGSYKGKHLGTYGHVGCFSFNADKILTAGEGGLVITDDRSLYEKMFCMMDGSGLLNPCNKDLFTEIKPFYGLSMRVSEFTGAILRAQLGHLEEILQTLRERKQILTETLELEVLKGDCGTTLHLVFDTPQLAAKVGKELRDQRIFAYPPMMQPAHVCWKWGDILGKEESSFHPERNPYKYSEKKYSYKMPFFLESADLLARTLKYRIDFDLTLLETTKLAKIIKELL